MKGIVWHYDEYRGCWQCEKCGLVWVFTDDGPEENGVNYCPKCGLPIVEFNHGGEGE